MEIEQSIGQPYKETVPKNTGKIERGRGIKKGLE